MRLLIVEDEPDLLRILQKALQEEGYAVDTAAEGEDGLYKAKAYDYDTIVLDLMLPKIDGLQVLQQLRQSKKTPVLILTARDAVSDRVKGLDVGADDYLVKPFDMVELSARVRALIRRAAGQAHPTLALGDVKIDTASRIVTKDAKVIALTPREYALLEFLALHRGQLVTRMMLYDHLFDENEDSLSNLLDVHISNLRKKLGKEIVVTRRGQGYLIDV